jgi:hypothetical protein
MIYSAANPEGVFDKVRECRFFLVLMADYEKVLDTEKFLFCLSAFLSAFRTTAYRLCGVVQTKYGKAHAKIFWKKLLLHTDVRFLKEATDLEVHGDGVRVWQRYAASVGEAIPERWTPTFWKDTNRFRSRHESFYRQVRATPQAIDWQFEARPENLIELCNDTLAQMEEMIRQAG